MLLKDVVEEITEKSPNFLSPASIVRKVSQVRDRLVRNLGSAQQQSDVVCTAIDLVKDKALYVLPCPPSNVVDVDVMMSSYNVYHNDNYGWKRIPLRQFNERLKEKPYYYFSGDYIGIVPNPEVDTPQGIKIFHAEVLRSLTLADMDGPTGFDPDFDMVLVYGVLKEITSGKESEEFDYKYRQVLNEYETATNGYERYSVTERW
ncbi:phage adaptor protein [Paenibacillus tundrae]